MDQNKRDEILERKNGGRKIRKEEKGWGTAPAIAGWPNSGAGEYPIPQPHN